VSCLCLVEALLRQRTSVALAMAVLLAASPFTFDSFMQQRRPDLIAVPVLVALGFVLLGSRRRRMWGCVGVGVALAVTVLVHEGTALYDLPWAVILVVLLAGSPALRPPSGQDDTDDEADAGRHWLWLLAAVTIPPVVAGTVVLSRLGASTSAVSAGLLADNPWFTDRSDHTVFVFLGDSFGGSLARVRALALDKKVPSLVFGAVLVAVQAWWIRRWCGHRLDRCLRSVQPRWAGFGALLGLVTGTVLVFATGIDWLRWFGALGNGWMIVSGFIVFAAVRRRRVEQPSPSEVRLTPRLPIVAAGLVALMPLTAVATTRSLVYTAVAMVVVGGVAALGLVLATSRARRSERHQHAG
jgi:hypothetical protein